MSNDENYIFARPGDYDEGFNQLQYTLDQRLARVNTSTMVKVTRIQPSGVALVGFLDCVPLVALTDGAGNTYDPPDIVNVPYFRLQGGVNAVIIDPAVDDIGVVVHTSRDISGVKNSLQSGPPGSSRKCDLSDALYFGGFRNKAPTRYIQFTDSGITIHGAGSADTVKVENVGNVTVNASSAVDVTAPTTTVHGDAVVTGNATVNGKTTTGTLQVL